jgi:hypothetical protein
MPGSAVKNWPQYEALRRQHYSKQLAARIANSKAKTRPRPLKAKARV